MVIGIIALVLGVLLTAAAIVFHKKITQAWMLSAIAGGLLVAIVGVIFTGVGVSANNKDKQNLRIALNYLEYQRVTEAAYYIKQVSSDSLCSLGTETLLEAMRGNDLLYQFKLDALEGKAKSEGEKSICLKLSVISRDDYSTQTAVIKALREELKLSKRKAQEADVHFIRESGYYIDGVEMEEDNLSEAEQQRLALNNCISNKNFSEAARIAAAMVSKSPSAKNRLMLADVIASAAYDQNYLFETIFLEDETLQKSVDEYREKLQVQIDSLTLDLNATRELLNSTTDETKSKQLQQEVSRLNTQVMKLQSESNYLLLDRAFNSIADLHSLEASVVRARLHFAKKDYENAMEALEKAVKNPIVRLTATGDVKNAVNILHKALKDSTTVGTETPEFRDAISVLVSNVGSDLVSIHAGELSSGFAEYISVSQKTYGKDLYVSHVDTSEFPKITITLSGRDSVLERVIAKKQIIIKDTHNTISFEVEKPKGESNIADICCVVDESGSMGGQPMEDLKAALSGFITSLQKDASIGIVGFSDSYQIRSPLSTDHESVNACVNDIFASGGTDISNGIAGGLEVLRESTKQKVILLMTDGQSGIDMSVVEQAAQTGTVINCIGFGGVNDELLQSIADATGGQYIRADSSSELINIYLSLVGVIGNHVKIRYTVDVNTTTIEEALRYFFIRDIESGVSVRVDYELTQQNQTQLNYIDNPMLSIREVQQADNYGNKIYFRVYGTGLKDTVSAKIGSLNCTVVEANESYVYLEVEPKLNAGWHTVLLTDKDGRQTQFDKAIMVADTMGYSYFLLGDLYIRCSDAAVLSDGTLIMENAIIADNRGSNSTTRINVQGLLSISVNKSDVENQKNQGVSQIELGDSGKLSGTGTAILSHQGNTDYGIGNEVVCRGSFHIECSNDRVRLMQD